MQFTKDSFYIALRDRLAQVNPARTIVVNGITQPAVLLAATQSEAAVALPKDCFLLSYGAVQAAKGFSGASQPLLEMACAIAYRTSGTEPDASDRERVLTALDAELLRITEPPCAEKTDYTQTPPQDLGARIFWERPQLGKTADQDGVIGRTATLTLFFHCEVSA
jgi:hypothetical protein